MIKPKKIVLVDDDPINNLITQRKLAKYDAGIELVLIESGQEALKYLQENLNSLPDLILLDINMPDFDGWQFLDTYLKLNFSIDIYIYTSSIDEADKAKASKFVVIKDYIIKPLNEDKIQRILLSRLK